MFSGIAKRYDFLNHFLSVNTDKRWRRLVRRKLEKELNDKNAMILDVSEAFRLAFELELNFIELSFARRFC